jgi:hypothetical protein
MQQIARDYQAGEPVEALCDHHEIDSSTLYEILHRLGTPPAPWDPAGDPAVAWATPTP